VDDGSFLVPEQYRSCRSRLGYEVEIFTANGSLKSPIVVPDDTSVFTYLEVGKINQLDDELKIVIFDYLKYIIERYHAGTLKHRCKFLLILTEMLLDKVEIDIALMRFTTTAFGVSTGRAIHNLKQFVAFLVSYGYREDLFSVYSDFLRLSDYSGVSCNYTCLMMMDEEHGPFTSDELSILAGQVRNERLPIETRLLLDLYLSFGMRPIQVSLLKRCDYIKDVQTGLRYLKVPRVKNLGPQRRQQFTIRFLSDQTADLLEQITQPASNDPAGVNSLDLPIFLVRNGVRLEHHWSRSSKRVWKGETKVSRQYYTCEKKLSFAYHRSMTSLAYALTYSSQHLPLSPRTGRPFNLNAYRFRYTLGTKAVMAGCTMEEVADLLDHANVYSVKHYFKFTHEMWEILEKATSKRIEQKSFVAAWMDDKQAELNMYTTPVIEPRLFTAIGKCASTSVCLEEPAIVCYSCGKFCPNKNRDAHLAALETLNQRRLLLKQATSEALLLRIDDSIAGCHAAVAYAAGQPVRIPARRLDDGQ
jgi:integrase